MSKGMMRAADLVIVDMEERRIAGRRDVSSEIGMHLLIYRSRSDVRGVVHAHPGLPPPNLLSTSPLCGW